MASANFQVSDRGTPILALQRRFNALNHGALAVARSAGRLGIPVYGVSSSECRWKPADMSRYLRSELRISETAPDDRWLESLLGVGERLGPTVLTALDDSSAVFVEHHRDALAGSFLLPEQPQGLQARLSSKRAMHDLCHEIGIPTPISVFPEDEEALLVAAAQLGYPVVLKKSEGWVESRDPGAPPVAIVDDAGQLRDSYRRMDSATKPNVILQEYVPGGSDSIWMFNGYFDRDSRCLAGFTGRKLRQQGPRTGPTTLGECMPCAPVADATKRLAEAVGYSGIIDIGFRYDARDQLYKLLDINPRLGSTFRLFVGDNGLDVVRAMYLDLTGQAVPQSSLVPGRKWLVEPFDVLSSLQLASARELGLREWLRSHLGIRELAWLSADDPIPFLAMLPLAFGRALSYGRTRP